MKGAIWQYDSISGREMLDQIKDQYIRCGIMPNKEVINHYQSYIIFDNGDKWQIIKANDSARGHAVNISYIDHRISHEIINCIIKPATKAIPYQAINYF